MKRTTIALAVISLMFLATAVFAGRMNHPNLAAANEHIMKAMERLSAAQAANEFDMDGHAAKAKELLRHASEEVKMAAMAATEHRKEHKR